MSAERWRRLRVLYDRVMDVAAVDRAAVLGTVKLSEPDLYEELLALCGASDAPDPLLDRPSAFLVPAGLVPGDILSDRFVIERWIGGGGMGDVWAARDRLRGTMVAVKTIKTWLAEDATLVARFKREIDVASRVAHPNVCRVHELFEDRSGASARWFFTMELLDGEPLSGRLERSGRLPATEALAVLRDLCAGLDAAHAVGIVHRDLKPGNIILTTSNRGRRAVITDFGLAKPSLESDNLSHATSAGMLMGTPAYMAPEQVRGAASTPATDIYALGLVLYEMLVGEPPFPGTSTMDSWMRRAREGPALVARSVPGVPSTIDAVLRRCLDYEPARRFQSAGALLAAMNPRRVIVRRALTAAAAVLAVVMGILVWVRRPATLPSDAQAWYDEAVQAVAEGAATRANNAVRRVLAVAPGFPTAHALQAEVHLEMERPGDAVEDMARASQLVADGARVTAADRLYVTGMHALVLHDCDVAVGRLRERAGISNPARPYWMVTAARAMERCSKFDDGLALLRSAAGLDARNAAIPLRTARVAGRRRLYPDAMTALDRADGLFRDRNNVEGRAEVLLMRGTLLGEQERLDDAAEALASALGLAKSIDNERQLIQALLQQAIVERKRGQKAAALATASEALGRARRAGLEPWVVESLFALGNAQLVALQFAAAASSFEEALGAAERLRNEEAVAGAHLRLASLFVAKGDLPAGSRELAVARQYYERAGDVRNLAKIDNFSAQQALQRGDFAAAEQALRLAIAAASTDGDTEAVAEARRRLADTLTASGAHAAASVEYLSVATYYHETEQRVLEAFARLNELDLRSRLGQLADSDSAIAAAAAVASDAPEVQRFASEVRAHHALRQGDLRTALTVASDARRSGDPDVWPSVITCQAAARRRDTATADAACRRVLSAAPRNQVRVFVPAVLAVAEARVWLGEDSALRDTLSSLAPVVAPLSVYDEAWRYAALSMHASTDVDRPRAHAAVTRELDRMRIRLGESYGGWRSRPDVVALFQRIDFREGN